MMLDSPNKTSPPATTKSLPKNTFLPAHRDRDGETETETLQALDVTGERMLIFHRQGRNLEQGVVQVQNLKSGKQCGVCSPDLVNDFYLFA